MKGKKKVILSSALAIALSASMIAGSTFALFTSESAVNIAVTSAKVKVTATVDRTSIVKEFDERLTKENASFEVSYINGVMSLKDMAAGDSVSFQIELTNESSISVKYRTTLKAGGDLEKKENIELFSALVATFDGEASRLGEGETYESIWRDFKEETKTVDVTVALPYESNVSGGECSLIFGVEAVQGNAEVYNKVSSAEDYKAVAKEGGNILLTEDLAFTDITDGDFVDGKTVFVDLNGKTLNGDNTNIATRVKSGEVTFANGTITAKQGTYCTVSAGGGVANIRNMMLNNCTSYGMSVKVFANGVANLYDTVLVSKSGGGATAAGGELNIYEGCTFTQTVKFDHNSCNVSASNGGTANIYGGTFQSDNYGIYVYNSGATINIYNGDFTAETVLKADKSTSESVPSVINVYDGIFDGKLAIANGAVLNVQGGTFQNTGLTFEAFQKFVAEGFVAVESEVDGVTVFTVVKAEL